MSQEDHNVNLYTSSAMEKAQIEADAKLALQKKRNEYINSKWYERLWKLWAYNSAKRRYEKTKEDIK